MDSKAERLLVLCVDRDDDLGRKAEIRGPIVGEKDNVKAASKLALADPTDSDVNAVFAAVKKYKELKEKGKTVEVATLTGFIGLGFEADARILEQLDSVLEGFPATGIVFISDGAEDASTIPVIQSRLPVISNEIVIIKQAKGLEQTYYTVKEALKDPTFAKMIFGIPGLIILLAVILGPISIRIMLFVLGFYLILRGLGWDSRVTRYLRSFVKSFSIQKTSFPFYLMMVFLLVFGGITSYSTFSGLREDLFTRALSGIESAYLFAAFAALCFVVGSALDSVSYKKAFKLKNHFISAVSIGVIWLILDSGTRVMLGSLNLYWFVVNTAIGFVGLVVAFRIAEVFNLKYKATKVLYSLPVFSPKGKWIGKVVEVVNRESISYLDNKGKKKVRIGEGSFVVSNGTILLRETKTA